MSPGPPPIDFTSDRIQEHVYQGVSDDDCWEWTGRKQTAGYGQTFVGGRGVVVHRLAYEHLVGPIPDGLVLDHLCRNRTCVNPAHLEPVSNKDNILRGVGPSAINARKTHCRRGHEFTPENTYRRPSAPQKRHCRICILLAEEKRVHVS